LLRIGRLGSYDLAIAQNQDPRGALGSTMLCMTCELVRKIARELECVFNSYHRHTQGDNHVIFELPSPGLRYCRVEDLCEDFSVVCKMIIWCPNPALQRLDIMASWLCDLANLADHHQVDGTHGVY
jgi:hypothetical protein